MKTSHFFLKILLILAIASFTLTSCQKEKAGQTTKDPVALTQLTTDETYVEDVSNETLQDVEGVLSYNFSDQKSTDRLPCNAVIDSTTVVDDTITIFITYDGLSCNGRLLRTGKVEVRKRVGTRWGMQGASVNVRFINFSVTRVRKGQAIVINSNKTFTNVSGGFINMLGNNGFLALTHKIEGTMSINMENALTRVWNMALLRTYTGTRGQLVLTIEGIGTSGEYENLGFWGINRNNDEFFTRFDQAVIYKSVCDWKPVFGIKVNLIPAVPKSATVTFGYNSDNQLVAGDECPKHFRLDWVNGPDSGTRFLPLR
ncbi:MAG: hypothetical protein K0B15_03460 [Lentimicrobium sp.]|nr:hypothetical protein [Lentimicrobium sp.]